MNKVNLDIRDLEHTLTDFFALSNEDKLTNNEKGLAFLNKDIDTVINEQLLNANIKVIYESTHSKPFITYALGYLGTLDNELRIRHVIMAGFRKLSNLIGSKNIEIYIRKPLTIAIDDYPYEDNLGPRVKCSFRCYVENEGEKNEG